MARAACLAPGEPIPYHLLKLTLHLPEAKLQVALQAEDGVNRLVELGLIRPERGNTLRLHHLIVAFIRNAALPEYESAREAVAVALYEEAKRVNAAGYPAPLLAWQSHLRAVTQAALIREDLLTAKLCNELGWHLEHVGDYASGRPYFEQALAIRQRILGIEHPDTAYSFNSLGNLLRAQGNLAGARPYFEHALAVREKILGEEHALRRRKHDTAKVYL